MMTRHAFLLLTFLTVHGRKDIVTPPPPFAGIQTFFGNLAPFTLDASCMSHWECAGEIDIGRASCGTLEDPCIARIRGDVGDSIFSYWTPGYMKNELLDGHVCGSVYEVNYDGGTEPVYVVIADIQPGYVTIQDQADPTTSPWAHLKDSWMPDTWNKEAVVSDYLEIEAAGWNALTGTTEWTEDCHEVNEDDMSPPADLPQMGFDAQLIAFGVNRRHNNDEMYQSKSFVRWLNYLRGLHGIPLPFSWHDGLAESQEEHVDALATGHRTDDADGRNERIEFANTVAPDLNPNLDYVEERVLSSMCSNCPRQFVKAMVKEKDDHEILLLPWSYVGFWCAPSRESEHVKALCSFMLGAKTPGVESGWGGLVEIVDDGDPDDEFTTTTTAPPTCEEQPFEFGPTIRFIYEATKVTEKYHEVWEMAWASMLSQWTWWLDPLPDIVEIEDWFVPVRFYTDLVSFSDKGEDLECAKVHGFIQLDDRALFMSEFRDIKHKDAGGGDVKKSQMDALYKSPSAGGAWDQSSTVVLFTMSPYYVDYEGNAPDKDEPETDIPTYDNGDYISIVMWDCQKTKYGNEELLIQMINEEDNKYNAENTSFIVFTDLDNQEVYEEFCGLLNDGGVGCEVVIFETTIDIDNKEEKKALAAFFANTLLEKYQVLEC